MKSCVSMIGYWMLLPLALSGCSGSNGRVHPPGIDSSAAGKDAVKQYDADGNGLLSHDELKKCPGLLFAFGNYDVDHDNHISATEITQRIQMWQATRIAMASLSCSVKQGSRPLVGAEVRFIPEAYLGTNVKPATGITGDDGTAIICVADADLPKSLRGIPGIHYGTYRVEITHPTIEIPTKYNRESTLGHEISNDIGNPYATFEL